MEIAQITIENSLIVYDDGYFSLDGAPVSTDTIGVQTQILTNVSETTITLENTAPVGVKLIYARGPLNIIGPGTLNIENDNVLVGGFIGGIYASDVIAVSGAAKVFAVGAVVGIYSFGITASEGSILSGEASLAASATLYAGIRNFKHILATDNSQIIGKSGQDVGCYGITSGSFYDFEVDSNATISGAGYVGVAGYHLIVRAGSINGVGTSIGVSGYDLELTNAYGSITGTCAQSGMAGVNIAQSVLVNRGLLKGIGGKNGVLCGTTMSVSTDGIVEGSAPSYGIEGGTYFGAVVANGAITCYNGFIVENYFEPQYFYAKFKLPYENGKNMSSYLNYDISFIADSGSGSIEIDPNGAGICATSCGAGKLKLERGSGALNEVIILNQAARHTINIPVILEAYLVTYNANGATSGTIPVDLKHYDESDAVAVLGNPGNLEKEKFVFAGWCLNAQGLGTVYNEGDFLTMPRNDVILYAVWQYAEPCICRCKGSRCICRRRCIKRKCPRL